MYGGGTTGALVTEVVKDVYGVGVTTAEVLDAETGAAGLLLLLMLVVLIGLEMVQPPGQLVIVRVVAELTV